MDIDDARLAWEEGLVTLVIVGTELVLRANESELYSSSSTSSCFTNPTPNTVNSGVEDQQQPPRTDAA